MELFWHGTSSEKTREILNQGLLARPPKHVYETHAYADWDRASIRTAGGVYLAADPCNAYDAGVDACMRFGGSPALIGVYADDRDALPDEDRIPAERIIRDILLHLGLSSDSDGFATFRRLWARGRPFRAQAQAAAVYVAHEGYLRAPRDMPASRDLMTEMMLSAVDRTLVHLSENMAVMGLLGSARGKLPFPVPATHGDIVRQEVRFLEIRDMICGKYRHLALRSTFANPLDQTIRIPGDVGFQGKARIVSVIQTADSVLRTEWGSVPSDCDLSRLCERRRIADGITCVPELHEEYFCNLPVTAS
jgi:hypothetical protein